MFYVKYNNQLQGPHFVSNKKPFFTTLPKVAYFGSNSTTFPTFIDLLISVCPFWVFFTTHQKLILYARLNLFRADVWHIKQWNMYNMDKSDFFCLNKMLHQFIYTPFYVCWFLIKFTHYLTYWFWWWIKTSGMDI